MTARDILIAARAKLATPERWTKGAPARSAARHWVAPSSPKACQWCAVGALVAVAPDEAKRFEAESMVLAAASPRRRVRRLDDWNDDGGRTHAQVIAAFDRAIEACK